MSEGQMSIRSTGELNKAVRERFETFQEAIRVSYACKDKGESFPTTEHGEQANHDISRPTYGPSYGRKCQTK